MASASHPFLPRREEEARDDFRLIGSTAGRSRRRYAAMERSFAARQRGASVHEGVRARLRSLSSSYADNVAILRELRAGRHDVVVHLLDDRGPVRRPPQAGVRDVYGVATCRPRRTRPSAFRAARGSIGIVKLHPFRGELPFRTRDDEAHVDNSTGWADVVAVGVLWRR